jgi:hypothetical protein
MLAARNEGHISSGLGQRRPESSANPAGSDHRDPHCVISSLGIALISSHLHLAFLCTESNAASCCPPKASGPRLV